MFRSRNRTSGTFPGGRIIGPTSSYSRSFEGGTSTSEVCLDYTSPGPPYVQDNNLDLRKSSVVPTRHSGQVLAYGVVPVQFEQVPIGLTNPDALPPHSPPNWASLETAALAELNPSAPVVDLGEFLFELRNAKDLVDSVKGIWDFNIRNNIGSDYLAYNFGWKPLISDLQKLQNLASFARKRLSFLRDKEKNGVRISLGTSSLSWIVTESFDSFPYTCLSFHSVNERTTNWCTGRYKILGKLPEVDDSYVHDNDHKGSNLLNFGLSQPVTSAWNSLPWSWLADYFANLGTFLEASTGSIPFTLTNVNLMSTSTMDIRFIRSTKGWGRGNPGSASSVEKRRRAIPVANARFSFEPLLTSGQKLNLTALAIAKSR